VQSKEANGAVVAGGASEIASGRIILVANMQRTKPFSLKEQ
jgi:hypothetical protein